MREILFYFLEFRKYLVIFGGIFSFFNRVDVIGICWVEVKDVIKCFIMYRISFMFLIKNYFLKKEEGERKFICLFFSCYYLV